MYKQDWIGLKQLDEDGKLKFMAVEVDICISYSIHDINI